MADECVEGYGEEVMGGISSPSIKLIKNSKGYNYEIKILELDVEKLKKLNEQMLKNFPNENNK